MAALVEAHLNTSKYLEKNYERELAVRAREQDYLGQCTGSLDNVLDNNELWKLWKATLLAAPHFAISRGAWAQSSDSIEELHVTNGSGVSASIGSKTQRIGSAWPTVPLIPGITL